MASKVTRPASCADGQVLKYSTGAYSCQNDDTGSGASLPAGAIVLIISGTCPSGFAEETALDARFLLGTLAANSDVGTTGGANSVTPAGTVSQPTFTGDALAAHSHGPGTLAADSATTGISVAAHSTAATGTSGGGSRFANAGAAAHTVTDNGHTHAVSGSTQSVSAGTPSGTVSQPTFTGNSQDNRPAFTRVIFCRKT
jgi:hypothetical protein